MLAEDQINQQENPLSAHGVPENIQVFSASLCIYNAVYFILSIQCISVHNLLVILPNHLRQK